MGPLTTKSQVSPAICAESRTWAATASELAFASMIAAAGFFGLGLIRPATKADAAVLAEIRNLWTRSSDGGHAEALGLLMDEVDFLDRLAIPHGEDYFCFVAELDGEVLGYVIGGGSRDLDRKAHGEIYELTIRNDATDAGIPTRLLARAFDNFDDAAFAGTLFSIPNEHRDLQELATAAGMRADPPSQDRPGVTRFERPLHGRAASSK